MYTALGLSQGLSRRANSRTTFIATVATVAECSGVCSASDTRGLEAQLFAQLLALGEHRKVPREDFRDGE